MGKPKAERRLADNEARAVARMVRVSPQKLNLVAQMIRGKKVESALADLEFSRKRIAGTVKKTLESAIANAENNHDRDDLGNKGQRHFLNLGQRLEQRDRNADKHRREHGRAGGDQRRPDRKLDDFNDVGLGHLDAFCGRRAVS